MIASITTLSRREVVRWFAVGLAVLVLLAGCGQNIRTTKNGDNSFHTTASLEQIHKAVGRVSVDRGNKMFQGEKKTTSVNGVESQSVKYTLPAAEGGEIVIEAVPQDGGYMVTVSGEPSLSGATTGSLIEMLAKKRRGGVCKIEHSDAYRCIKCINDEDAVRRKGLLVSHLRHKCLPKKSCKRA